MFDSSIGACSTLMPYGGKYQLTETQAMVAKVPVADGNTDVVTMMAYGFNPYVSAWSPYHGSQLAVLESVARIVATGGDYKKIRFTFQEYFRRMSENPKRWSQPFAALLGAYKAQMEFGLPSIGGKDSMSGTFNEIDVPPTLVSFAVDVAKEQDIVTPELKEAGDKLYLLRILRDNYDQPNYSQAKVVFEVMRQMVELGNIKAAYALDAYGLVPAVSKMAFGNKFGIKLDEKCQDSLLFGCVIGDIVVEVSEDSAMALMQELEKKGISDCCYEVGEVTDDATFTFKDTKVSVDEALAAWTGTLEPVFKTRSHDNTSAIETNLYEEKNFYICKNRIAKPRVFIPVFPGTNCEYDSARAFEKAGAITNVKVFKNLSANDIRESVDEFSRAIAQSQIVMFPGGFSAGDEPEGSAKFFATAFRNEKMKEAIHGLLNNRDGLMLGICNGFQALIKLGLVPFGEIHTQDVDSPTLTYNTIGRHISKIAYTKVVSNKSPWLAGAHLGATYCSPASHGEGRFVASKEWIKKLFENGQVATQYCDIDGNISMDEEWNINGSYCAIEGITSPDGRIFGKMAHVERKGKGVALNIYGNQDLKIFESGVDYFR